MILGLNPADFSVGSAQSRAAARLLLTQRNTLSRDDEDALTLYCGTVLLDASMDPDYSALEGTSAYHRGKELYDSRHGPIVPTHLDDHLKRSTRESLEFEFVFRREPKAGDVLKFADMQLSRGLDAQKALYGSFIEAWHRQIPGLLCPYKFEGDRLFRHLRKSSCSPYEAFGDGWREAIDAGPAWNWREVEDDVKRAENPDIRWIPRPDLKDIPTIPSIVFTGVIDGEHRCRPVTDAEITAQPEVKE